MMQDYSGLIPQLFRELSIPFAIKNIIPFSSNTNNVFRVSDYNYDSIIVKIGTGSQNFEKAARFADLLNAHQIRTTKSIFAGTYFTQNKELNLHIYHLIEGTVYNDAPNESMCIKLISCISKIHRIPVEEYYNYVERLPIDWWKTLKSKFNVSMECLFVSGFFSSKDLQSIQELIVDNIEFLEKVLALELTVLHGDTHISNFVFQDNDIMPIDHDFCTIGDFTWDLSYTKADFNAILTAYWQERKEANYQFVLKRMTLYNCIKRAHIAAAYTRQDWKLSMFHINQIKQIIGLK